MEYGDSQEYHNLHEKNNNKMIRKKKRKVKSEKCKYMCKRIMAIFALIVSILMGIFLITDIV